MREQNEITAVTPLLDEKGDVATPGWARRQLFNYSRVAVKAAKTRLKEWDYYLVSNGHFALALTVDDNGYMGLDSISLLALDEGWEITKSPMQALTLGKKNLPETSAAGDVGSDGAGYGIHFLNRPEEGKRILIAQMRKFGPDGPLSARIELTEEPEESMVIATPFDKPAHFYYNQKINCMRASGYVTYGERTFTFDPADSFAVLDWGRGVWTYENTWYWGSASYVLPDGKRFGWNIGYGFGNTAAASENVLFYEGKAHKLSEVKFGIPGDDEGKPRYTEPWKFTSDDGRFEMDFVPQLDRKSCTSLKVIMSDQHQVFGRFTGKAILDDGTVIEVADFPGFAEKVYNKW